MSGESAHIDTNETTGEPTAGGLVWLTDHDGYYLVSYHRLVNHVL